MHPTSFFGTYTPPEGNPYSYHLHSAVRPPPQAPVQAPPYRPGRPYFPPHPSQPDQDNLPGPVPRPGPTWPHYPPPFSPPETALVPAYSASAPPPAYSSHKLDADECRCDSDGEYDDEEEGDRPDGVRKVVILILIGMNVLVWGMVFYYWIQDDLMSKLWAEIQAEGGVRFQI